MFEPAVPFELQWGASTANPISPNALDGKSRISLPVKSTHPSPCGYAIETLGPPAPPET